MASSWFSGVDGRVLCESANPLADVARAHAGNGNTGMLDRVALMIRHRIRRDLTDALSQSLQQ